MKVFGLLDELNLMDIDNYRINDAGNFIVYFDDDTDVREKEQGGKMFNEVKTYLDKKAVLINEDEMYVNAFDEVVDDFTDTTLSVWNYKYKNYQLELKKLSTLVEDDDGGYSEYEYQLLIKEA